MTELTKEQLIEEAKLKIAIAKCHPNSGVARVEGELFKIALASLEAEAPNLPGGFTIEEAKELHENLVKSHASKALSGEKMKKENRDADLRWIHGVIVQAAWFVKASLEQNALSGNYPVTPDSWISCSERTPEKGQNVLISVNFDSSLVEPLICSARYTGRTFRRGDATIKPGNGIEQATHWMPLPEPPQEEKSGNADCSDTSGKTDNPQASGKQVNELTMLVKQLVSQLKKAKPDCKLPDKAMDYLKRNGLISVEDILR
ncbi:TPA: DUF551 domain-containing protein [Escherichia coli]|nr:DUF551 domain-containing protein [Escherichia coli]HEL8044670.1 DUF551 domain-containing protein [Escherichia coli]HEL8049435.1 DUF551 domain-containing protein [Escherichia coli]HEL8054194.1 DUF551 domain-containing protein [Escherichia coli]HEL8059040.1 DUF551 domain-containing protein [Escherichia coli]